MARTKHTTAQSEPEVRVTKTPKDGGIKKKKRTTKRRKDGMSRINVKAGKEIRAQQKKTDVIIPRTSYMRLAKYHIANILGNKENGIRMSSSAKYVLQQAVETTATELFENAMYAKDLITDRQRLERKDFLGPIKNDATLNALFAPWVDQQYEEIMQSNEQRILERTQKDMDEKVRAAEERQKKKDEKEKRKKDKETEAEEEEEEEPEKEKEKKKKKGKDKKKHKKRSKPASEDEAELSSKQKKKKKKKSKD